jgi:hypothetical protein
MLLSIPFDNNNSNSKTKTVQMTTTNNISIMTIIRNTNVANMEDKFKKVGAKTYETQTKHEKEDIIYVDKGFPPKNEKEDSFFVDHFLIIASMISKTSST